MEAAYFITATGTDAGKTFVTEGLVRAWRGRGHAVRALKPVMSGYDETACAESDAGRLLAACGLAATVQNVAAISPWRFAAPLSPDLAAAREGRHIDVDALIDWCRAEGVLCEGTLLIEGIGGVMVPLDEKLTVRNWIAAQGLPTLLVAGTYLGAISHALSALAALREVGVVPRALIVNASLGGVGLDETMASLRPHLGGVPLLSLGRDEAKGCERLLDALLALPA